MKKTGIPKEDLEDINKTFKSDVSTEALNKGASGQVVSTSKQTVNQGRGYTIKNYEGCILKHNKSLIPVGGTQMAIGHKGQKFDDIPKHLRSRIAWLDSDFE